MKALKERLGFSACFSFHRCSHQRRRRFGNRAAVTGKLHVANDIALHFERDRHVIAAQRVLSVGTVIRRRKLAKIARLAVVIEDDGLVEILQVVVFSILFGLAASSLGSRVAGLIDANFCCNSIRRHINAERVPLRARLRGGDESEEGFGRFE